MALHSVAVEREGRLPLVRDGSSRSGASKVTWEAAIELDLASRDPDALAALKFGEIPPRVRFRALDERGREVPEVRAGIVSGSPSGDGGPRLRVCLRGMRTPAQSVQSVEGALIAYPRARRIRFHVPWSKEDLPMTVEYGGARATLRRFHLVGDESTLWVAIRPPEGFRVASLSEEGTLTARAMDIYGNLVNGGAITETVQTLGGAEPEFRFYAPVLRRIPSRLMLDVVCVAGEPQPVPFKIGPIPLPRIR